MCDALPWPKGGSPVTSSELAGTGGTPGTAPGIAAGTAAGTLVAVRGNATPVRVSVGCVSASRGDGSFHERWMRRAAPGVSGRTRLLGSASQSGWPLARTMTILYSTTDTVFGKDEIISEQSIATCALQMG